MNMVRESAYLVCRLAVGILILEFAIILSSIVFTTYRRKWIVLKRAKVLLGRRPLFGVLDWFLALLNCSFCRSTIYGYWLCLAPVLLT